MRDSGTAFFFSQLAAQAPALIVYIVAFVLALTYMGRARRASILALIGAIVSVVATIGAAGAQAHLLNSSADGLGSAGIAQMMAVAGITGAFLKAGGLALFIAAIFVERAAPDHRPGSERPAAKN